MSAFVRSALLWYLRWRRFTRYLTKHPGKSAIVFATAVAIAVAIRKHLRPKRPRIQQGASAAAATATPHAAGSTKRHGENPAVQLKKILAILMPKLTGHAGRQLLGMALMCIVRTAVNNKLAMIQGDLFKAVFLKDTSVFVRLIVENIVGNLTASALQSTMTFLTRGLTLSWQRKLTDKIARSYFSSMTYYRLAFVDKRIADPEQVFTNDLPNLVDALSDVSLDVMKAICDGSYFTYRTFKEIGPYWGSMSWIYIAFALTTTQTVAPPFGKLMGALHRVESEYRRVVGNVSDHAESIAAYSGHEREWTIIKERFAAVYKHVNDLIRTQWLFGILDDFIVKYLVSTVAMVMILGPFFGGKLRGDRTLVGDAITLSRVRYSTSIIIYNLQAVGGLAMSFRKYMKMGGYLSRVAQLLDVSKELDTSSRRHGTSNVQEGDCIAFDNVTIHTPTGNKLVENLTFRVEPGTNLLLTGPNGAGKSSLFRCLGSLWHVSEGRVTKPNSRGEGLFGDVFYLPQKPYNVLGTLRDQLSYPRASADDETLTDEKLEELLSLVDLTYLMQGNADDQTNWESKLSLGETQRLAMARLFYHKPHFAILDECTSGVTTAMEERLYELCKRFGITCITISHRPALESFHDVKLTLNGKGGYDFARIHNTLDQSSNSLTSLNRVQSVHQFVSKSQTPADTEKTFAALRSILPKSKPTSFLARLRRLAGVLIPSITDSSSIKLVMLAGVVVIRVILSDRQAHINGHTVNFLLKDDALGFAGLVGQSLVQCALSAFMSPLLLYLTRQLSIDWRRKLSEHMFSLYFKVQGFYATNSLFPDISHPDQRLVDDLQRLCIELSNIFPDVIKPVVDVGWFTYQTYILLGARNTAYLYVYMIAGLGLLRVIQPSFHKLVEKTQELEGVYRYVHTRLRTHAESIAFFGGCARESAIISGKFETLLSHHYVVAKANWIYGTFDDFVTKQLPHIVTWGLSLAYTNRMASRGKDLYSDHGGQLGHDLRFVASAVSHTFLAFGELMELYKRVMELSGYLARVTELEEFLIMFNKYQLDSTRLASEGKQLIPFTDAIVFENVDVVNPTGKCLVYGLTCTVQPGHHLLIDGPNGSGKSSVFRVLGGLWPARRGRLTQLKSSRGTDTSLLFLVPQRPYNPIGSLADLITYPRKASVDAALDAKLRGLLEVVQLSYLVDREGGWGAVANWADVLSLGEQQRLGMARLFYHAPKFAVLDQCTDAVSVDVEEQLYQFANKLNITIITISQRPGLLRLHSQELRLLDGRGNWDLNNLISENIKSE